MHLTKNPLYFAVEGSTHETQHVGVSKMPLDMPAAICAIPQWNADDRAVQEP